MISQIAMELARICMRARVLQNPVSMKCAAAPDRRVCRGGARGFSALKTTSADSGPLLRQLRRNPAMLCVGLFALFAIAAYVPRLLLFLQGLQWPELTWMVTDRDFANYWMAGQMVVNGSQQELFTQEIYFARMLQVFGEGYSVHNWGYPPHLLLLLWPLGFMNYVPALFAFLAVTFGLFVAAVLVFRHAYAPRADWTILLFALLGYSLLMLDASQNGFLLAAVLLFGLAFMKDRPVLAGLAFGLLTVKPQLGFLLPLLLAFDRNWKTIGWAAFFTVLLVGLSAVLFGLSSWTAYLIETQHYQRFVMTNGWGGIFLSMMPTVFGSVRALGFSPEHAYLAQWPVSISALALTTWLFLREHDPLRRIFVLTCATFLISPYAFNYDMGALSVVAALLVGSQQLASRAHIVFVSIVAGLPAAVMNLGRSNLPVAPLLLAAALLAVALEARRPSAPTGA
jgi:arabinofuranan 3-O-arabinosyltransferase